MTITKSEYVLTLEDGTQKKVVSETMISALLSVLPKKAVSAVLDHTVEVFEAPDTVQVEFEVEKAAYECGCRAYPSDLTELVPGSQLILSATEANGYNFLCWECNGSVVATTKQALVTVPVPEDDTSKYIFTARYRLDY